MLYVIDTPPIFGYDAQTQQTNDKVYGLDGHLSFPVLQDIQAIVELWAQYYGCTMSEWSQGAQSSDTRWDFWFSKFKPSRSFLDYQRMYNLCRVDLPIGYSQAAMSHRGSLWLDYNPFTRYPDFCAQNALFEFCDGEEGFINTAFNSSPPQTFYLNESSTTGITPAEPLKNASGTHPFTPNQFALKNDIIQMWQNVQFVANRDLYLLTPERNMFYSGGSFGQPFDMAYNQGTTYQRWEKTQKFNSINSDFTRDVPFYSGYYDTTFTMKYRWSMTAEDDAVDPEHYYHYVWEALDDRLVKTNQDQWLWKHVPIPSSLFGEHVLDSRDLLIVWKVSYTTGYKWSGGSEKPATPTIYYYVSRQPYTKGSYSSRFVDLNGYDYGLVQQWRFPFSYFDTLYQAVMQDIGFLPSTDPNSGWGSDTSTHQKSGNYLISQEYGIEIEPVYFYSLQKDRLTQTVDYPNDGGEETMRTAKVQFQSIKHAANFSAEEGNLKPEYTDGKIYFVEDEGKIYVDLHNKRTLYDNGSEEEINNLKAKTIWYDDDKPLQEGE